jgi:hypothetical protein
MLDRFLGVQESVKAVLLVPEWKKKMKVTIRADDWLLMGRAIQVLKIFQDATVQLYALGPGGFGDQGVKDLRRRLHANVLNRLGDKEKDDNYSIATVSIERSDLRNRWKLSCWNL